LKRAHMHSKNQDAFAIDQLEARVVLSAFSFEYEDIGTFIPEAPEGAVIEGVSDSGEYIWAEDWIKTPDAFIDVSDIEALNDAFVVSVSDEGIVLAWSFDEGVREPILYDLASGQVNETFRDAFDSLDLRIPSALEPIEVTSGGWVLLSIEQNISVNNTEDAAVYVFDGQSMTYAFEGVGYDINANGQVLGALGEFGTGSFVTWSAGEGLVELGSEWEGPVGITGAGDAIVASRTEIIRFSGGEQELIASNRQFVTATSRITGTTNEAGVVAVGANETDNFATLPTLAAWVSR